MNVVEEVRRRYATATQQGSRPVQVRAEGENVTIPAWVLESLLKDSSELQAWRENHYEELDDDE